MATTLKYAPTPASYRSKPQNRRVRAIKTAGGIAATAGVAYLGYRNRTALGSYAKIAQKTFSKYKVKGSIQYRRARTTYKAMVGPRMRSAARYARYSHKPFTVGYKSARMANFTRKNATRLGMRNMYQAHRPHVKNAMNKGAAAYHSYRRIRRDYKGRFRGSF